MGQVLKDRLSGVSSLAGVVFTKMMCLVGVLTMAGSGSSPQRIRLRGLVFMMNDINSSAILRQVGFLKDCLSAGFCADW